MTGPRFTAEELVAATGGRWLDPPPAAVAGLSTDTRTLAAGSLFVALRGERFDASAFLPAAAAAGAAAAVVASERGGPAGLPRLLVADTLAALGAMARLHRRRFELPVVGVTGSNGKTTTREMIAAILGERGPVLKTEGNLNNEVGRPAHPARPRPRPPGGRRRDGDEPPRRDRQAHGHRRAAGRAW